MSHLWHLLLLSLLLWAVHPLLTYLEKSIYVAKNCPIFITSYFPSNLILISYLWYDGANSTSRTGYYIYAYSFDLQTQNISFYGTTLCEVWDKPGGYLALNRVVPTREKIEIFKTTMSLTFKSRIWRKPQHRIMPTFDETPFT